MISPRRMPTLGRTQGRRIPLAPRRRAALARNNLAWAGAISAALHVAAILALIITFPNKPPPEAALPTGIQVVFEPGAKTASAPAAKQGPNQKAQEAAPRGAKAPPPARVAQAAPPQPSASPLPPAPPPPAPPPPKPVTSPPPAPPPPKPVTPPPPTPPPPPKPVTRMPLAPPLPPHDVAPPPVAHPAPPRAKPLPPPLPQPVASPPPKPVPQKAPTPPLPQINLPPPPPPAPPVPTPPIPVPAPATPLPVPPAPAPPTPPPPSPDDSQAEMNLELPPLPEFAPIPLPLPPPPLPPAPPRPPQRIAGSRSRTRSSSLGGGLVMNGLSFSGGGSPSGGRTTGLNLDLPETQQPGSQSDLSVRGDVGANWQAELEQWVNAHKYYPEMAGELNQEGTVVIRFTVDRAGHVSHLAIVTPTRYALLNEAWLGLFRGADLPPFPPDAKSDTATITASMRFEILH